jgi:hypothetical protein
MARQITKELALKITKKLGGQIQRGQGAHDLVLLFHDETLVATFGLRRGSEKDKGHDHIPSQIHVSPNFAKQLAQCSKSREDWIAALRQRGLIPTNNE